MIRRTTIAIVGAAFVGLVAGLVLSWRASIAPIDRPAPESFSADSVAHGEALAAAGHCVSCHSRPGGEQFAGGYGVNTPFGIILGTNITPESRTGIGTWSLAAFARAMREGVARDGSHLFPAFPYYAYTKLSDGDIAALYAYLMTRRPVIMTTPANTVPFPLNIRALQEGWKIFFFESARYRNNPSNTDEWNAPAINAANPSPIPWTQDELFTYLRTGVTPLHGTTGATMTPVIREGLALPVVPDSDVRAIALYFSDLNHASQRAPTIEATLRQALATSSVGSGQEYDPDANLYAAACMACHYNAGPVPLSARPELALNSALTLSDPTNFIQVVLNGVSSHGGAPGLVMPAYASSLTDSEIARLGPYLRRTRTTRPAWTDLEKKVSAIRRQPAASR